MTETVNGYRWTALILLMGILSLQDPGVVGHERQMIELGYPTPPPTVDPGPDAATLRLTVRDRATGELVSATVSVNRGDQEPDEDRYREYSLRRSANRHKGPIRFRPLDYYFFTDGRFSVKVPPGHCRVLVRKGYEYTPAELLLNLDSKQTFETTILLDRWINMAEQGWYSGDLHLHLERTGDNDGTLLTLTSARDIKYGFILSMNTKGYDSGRDFEAWRQNKGLGDKSVSQKGPYFISSGQEYRAQFLGHANVVLSESYVPALGSSEDVNAGPSLSLIADQAHQRQGYMGLCHGGYDHGEADGLGLTGKMDFLELLQFGGYRGLGLDGWYDFLNIGYRWPMVAGSDFPYTRELGDCITFARHGEPPTVREFVEEIARGASFVTSGPMLFLEVDDRRPGDLLVFESEEEVSLPLKLTVRSPQYPVRYLEIIQDGQAVSREFAPMGRTLWEYHQSIRVSKSGWLAARAYGDAGTDSHTNPIYIYMGGKLPFNPDACDQILARLKGSVRTIPNPEIVAHLEKLMSQLETYRDRREPGSLNLPRIPSSSDRRVRSSQPGL